MKNLLFIPIIIIILLSCNCSPDLKNVKTLPENLNLKGVYYPDDITLDEVVGFSTNPNAVLILDTDSTFILDQFPASALDFDDYYNKNIESVKGYGTWSLHNDGSRTYFYISLHYTYSSDSTTNGYGTSWQLKQKDGEYYIYFNVGDPDECNSIRLKRN